MSASDPPPLAPWIGAVSKACAFAPGEAVGDVRFWHKADIAAMLGDVRFWGQSGHWSDAVECLLLTQSGNCQRQPDHFQPPSLTRYDDCVRWL